MSKRRKGPGGRRRPGVPLTKVRSTWNRQPPPTGPLSVAQAWQRDVHDGHLTAFVTVDRCEGGARPLHLSISHRTNTSPPRPGRYPTWDEIADARYQLLPDDRAFALLLPPSADFLSQHDTTFHLHEVDQPPGPADFGAPFLSPGDDQLGGGELAQGITS